MKPGKQVVSQVARFSGNESSSTARSSSTTQPTMQMQSGLTCRSKFKGAEEIGWLKLANLALLGPLPVESRFISQTARSRRPEYMYGASDENHED